MTKLKTNFSSTHPIFNQSEFMIKTPMMEELESKLQHWLWNGITGGLIVGNYRVGKTRATQYIANRLKNRSDQLIPVHRLTIHRRDVNTVASIFRNLCLSLNKKISLRARADDMSNDLIHYFGELAMSNDTNQVVLIVDEMHRLNIHQLEAFAELYDRLVELKVNISVFFIGNYTATQDLIKKVLSSENELIRGRFFTDSYIYHGLQSHAEVKKCLKQYDDVKFPLGENQSVTEYFLKVEYDKGWRLNELSHEIWEVFYDNYKSQLKLSSWPMQYFISTLKTLIIDYLPRYGIDDNRLTYDMIDESIKASGLIPNLVCIEK